MKHEEPKTFDTALSDNAIFWKDIMAPKFMKYKHIIVEGLSNYSVAVIPKLPIGPGDHILDVGCGFGDTAVALNTRAGPKSRVLGVDCVPAFIEDAWNLTDQLMATNVKFACRDAEFSLPKGVFDFVFSRFGTMFFSNPVAGLRNMRTALKQGGKMTHIVWRERENNPWANAAREVLLKHLPPPSVNAATCGPGPFSMADKEVTSAQMKAAGFTDIVFEQIDEKVLVGTNIQEAIDFQLALGPAGEIYRTAGDAAMEKDAIIRQDLNRLFETASHTGQGIWLDGSAWAIHARAH